MNYKYDYNYGELMNEAGGTITNYAYDYNHGTITNEAGGSLQNSGTMYDSVNRYIYDYGTLYNGYSAPGVIYIGGTVYDESGGTIDNGQPYVPFTGTIYDTCGGMVNETGSYTYNGGAPMTLSGCLPIVTPQFPLGSLLAVLTPIIAVGAFYFVIKKRANVIR